MSLFLALSAIVIVLILLSQIGVTMTIALFVVSLVGFAILRDDLGVSMKFMAQATADSIASYEFSIIPLFVFMGILVSSAGLGRDLYIFANVLFRRLSGSLAIATIWANAAFAAISGVSIASLAVFTNIAIPEMLRAGYNVKFSVGVVAGSSILGMLIPPSLLFIIYGTLTETSIGDLFIAGIVPGLFLALIYSITIFIVARFFPKVVYVPITPTLSGPPLSALQAHDNIGPVTQPAPLGLMQATWNAFPVFILIFLILGGIYGGYMTATEAGAVGAFVALVVSFMRRKMNVNSFLDVAWETASITASICILIIAASFFSRVIAVAGLPEMLGQSVLEANFALPALLGSYILVLLFLGMLSGAASVILIAVPIFFPIFQQFPEVNLIWLGVITVFTVEIGMITPPVGVAIFVIKTCLSDDKITLGDIFKGAAPYTVILLFVLMLLILIPEFSLILL